MGVSFVLKGRYESVNAMVRAFKGGSAYTVIHYGEYVIIDTKNKQDIDNGKIYRRGYDYQNNMGGAEYIGQVVGPSSGTPYFQLNTLEATKQEATKEVDNEVTWKRYPTGKTEDGKYTISENGNGADIAEFDFSTKDVLVPGKTDEGEWNDTIKYTWVNIRDDTNAAESWFYVGFQIPYTVIDYNIHSVSPYDAKGNREDKATVVRTDDKSHPYWEEWELGVPKGVKGDTLRHLHIIVPTEEDVIYDLKNITTSIDENGKYSTTLGESGYDGLEDDIENERQILVIDYIVYDNTSDGEEVLVYVGDYNTIVSVNLEDDGTLIIDYTHDDDTIFSKKIKWVVKGNVDDKGIVTFTLNTDEVIKLQTTEDEDFHLKFVEDVKLETDIQKSKRIQVKYNTNDDYIEIGDPINYIQDMVVRAIDWHLLVLYTDPSHRFKSEDGVNTPHTEVQDQHKNIWINSITGTDGTVYPDDVYWQDMGPIKDQAGLLVGFNVTWNDILNSTTDNILDYLNETYPQGLTGEEQIPGGMSTKDKVVTYGDDPTGAKEFYAFDYDKKEWYFLGSIDANADAAWDIRYVDEMENQTAYLRDMRVDAVLLRHSEDIPDVGDPWPQYWDENYQWPNG